ncbi:DUF4124 domain-containing protein [Hahella ganghwensis]|uniref:DUF4124 domain-containing protein n=1 Tax=Hahella ganghwensis TaxID=286420 RepID=UPI00036C9F6C|nr:DUF4124 domain-containing protein [Hahella ganghwensis]
MEHNQTLVVVMVFLATFFAATNASAQIYKWVDEHGQVHFSDQPLEKGAEKVEVKNIITPSQKKEAQKTNQNFQRIYQQFKEQDKARAEQQKEAEQKRQEMVSFCDNLKKQISIVDQKYAVVRFGEDGRHEYLRDDEISEYRNEMNNLYQEKCSGL